MTGTNIIVLGYYIGDTQMGPKKWGGPCPPVGHGIHHYYFKIYGLDRELKIDNTTKKEGLIREMDSKNCIVAYGEIVGEYER